MQALLGQVENMLTTGNEMIEQTEQLETALNDGIAVPVQNIAGNLQSLSQQLGAINQQLATLDTTCQSAVDDLNAKIADYNNKVDAAQSAATSSKATINSAISELQTKKDQTTDETAKADLQAAIDKLNAASNAADGLLDWRRQVKCQRHFRQLIQLQFRRKWERLQHLWKHLKRLQMI